MKENWCLPPIFLVIPSQPDLSSNPLSTVTDKLFIALQYVLPARLIGTLVHRLARSRRRWLKNTLIRAFTFGFDIDQNEMDADRAVDYPSFNAFFTRALRSGVRPIDADPRTICSPADGTVQQTGHISAGRMLQAKDMSFSIARLLDTEPTELTAFDGGAFMTIYLAPHNYHRVHAPLDGSLRRMHFVPGSRFSVNRVTTDSIPDLFARNERIACQFDGVQGPYWLVFVGAMNVASISTAWSGEFIGTGNRVQELCTVEAAPAFSKGDYIGHFNLGSTIIVIFPRDTATLDSTLQVRSGVTVGSRIGSLRRTTTA